jgi:hypothetical protein
MVAMTTVTVHDNCFDSFVGAGESSVITPATPAALPLDDVTFAAARNVSAHR